jgi:hypothetical protein
MTTLATQLQTSIEAWADDLRQRSQISSFAKSGRLTPRAVALYLESLRYLLRNSQLNLLLAADTSKQLGCMELSAYFDRKASEERGHEHWAIDDLKRLPDAATVGVRPSPAIVSLVELQRKLIAEHPVCFVAYALWAEYFTVLLGDEWLEALASCGFERTQITAITKHLEADREHAAHGFGEIDRLWDGQPDRTVIVAAVERAGRIFEEFCDEICVEAARAA